MPYIITTYEQRLGVPCEACGGNGFGENDSDCFACQGRGDSLATRRAVATLDEARKVAQESVRELRAQTGERFAQLDALTDSGGTVGPLPDGTVIEVSQASTLEVAQAAGWTVSPDWRDTTVRAICDAYNAAQEV